MKKHGIKARKVPLSGADAVCLILAAAFLVGGIAGCILVNSVGGEGETALGTYLEGYFSSLVSGVFEWPGFFELLWETFRWPLFVVLLGLTPLGLLGLPAAFLVRGFLLSFSAASLFRIFDFSGLILAFVLFGVTGIVCIPVLFQLGVQGFTMSCFIAGRLIGAGRKPIALDRSLLLRNGVYAATLCVSCLLECRVTPAFVELLLPFLLEAV